MPQTAQLGIVLYALSHHARLGWNGRHLGLATPLALLEESRRLGAGGIQCPLGLLDPTTAADLHRRAQSHPMHVEASIMPPSDHTDLDRFEKEVQVAKQAGASLARTVILPGRRYEEFQSLSDFQAAEARAERSLQLAEPILARQRFQLAVENHKDQRVPERLALLRRLSSEWIGACVDVGNSYALLEDPLEVVQAFAPYALTVHLKDQGLRSTHDGFLFADLPLGQGFLDLDHMLRTLRASHPRIRFNLEMITRDALRVPILTDPYWTTLGDVPASDLARALRLTRQHQHPYPFPEISALSASEQLAAEEQNVRMSLQHAVQHLEL